VIVLSKSVADHVVDAVTVRWECGHRRGAQTGEGMTGGRIIVPPMDMGRMADMAGKGK